MVSKSWDNWTWSLFSLLLSVCRTLEGRSLTSKPGTFGSQAGRQQVYVCSRFLDPHLVVTGTQEGSIYVWNEGGLLIHIVPKSKAHSGEIFDICVRTAVSPARNATAGGQPPEDDDGAHERAQANVFHVLSGGADGKAIMWRFEKKGKEQVVVSKLYHVEPSNCCIRSVFIMHSQFAVGTAHNQLYVYPIDTASDSLQVEGDKRDVVTGHSEGKHKEGRVNCVCCCPDKDKYLFATGGSDDTVVLWDMRQEQDGRKAIPGCTTSMVSTPMAMDWSDVDGLVAVILKSGSIVILQVQGDGVQNATVKKLNTIPGKGCGSAIRFSPDAKFLAAGRRSGRLDLFASSSPGDFKPIKEKGFSAHPGPCCALDWASLTGTGDLCYLRSNSYEPEDLLFWQVSSSAQSTKQVRRLQEIEHCEWHKEQCRVSWQAQGLIRGQGQGPASDLRPGGHVPCLVSPPSSEKEHLACGCEDGAVRLFLKPCLSIRALGRAYFGHSAPIHGLAYSCDSRGLITCGDRLVILQWEVTIPKGAFAADTGGEGTSEEDKDSVLQTLFQTLHSKVRAHDFAEALDCLDDAWEQINESIVGESWKNKLMRETKQMVEQALIRGTHLKEDAASYLEQRDIDRQGWPVTRKLDEMRSLVKLFESFGKLFPELQPDMEQIKCLEPEADAMDAQIQEYTGQVGPLLIALTLL